MCFFIIFRMCLRVWGVNGGLLWAQWHLTVVTTWALSLKPHLKGGPVKSYDTCFVTFFYPGERPFSCPHCNRAFADRSNLRAHLQTHAEVKKYQCGICSRTFSRMSLLQKHSSSGCCSTAVWGTIETDREDPHRAQGSGGLVVYTSPAGLFTTCKATKSMKWPALRDLEGIKPHYWIWYYKPF